MSRLVSDGLGVGGLVGVNGNPPPSTGCVSFTQRGKQATKRSFMLATPSAARVWYCIHVFVHDRVHTAALKGTQKTMDKIAVNIRKWVTRSPGKPMPQSYGGPPVGVQCVGSVSIGVVVQVRERRP